ncbi:MAG: carboxymuconolactone decarboxylase family protein [Streptosporangiaceae bacterium]|jgi:4-carboxymuconolactone decarboxylase
MTDQVRPGEAGPDERRKRGLDTMSAVYGWDVQDGPGDFFAVTVDHLFGDIWTRPGLTIRDRRLLVLGVLAAQGQVDLAEIQVKAALGNGELDADQLREAALFLTHYVGWPLGANLAMRVDAVLAKKERAEKKAAEDA